MTKEQERGRRLIARLLAVFVVGTMAATAATTRSPTQDDLPSSIFGEVITVRVVNLEVVVTDRKGERVSGLQPEDFRLRVDQRETPIEFFSEILEGAVQEGEELFPAAPGVVEGRASVNYLVFVDDFFSIARDRNAVLNALEDDLELLGPDDHMAVVAYDGRDLKELAGWTNAPLVLRSAFEQARRRKSFGLQRLGELRSNDDTGATRSLRRYFASRLALQVERSVMAATATMRSFSSIPGRKVLLLLSGGWPSSPSMYAYNFPSFPSIGASETRIPSYSELLGPLSDTANLLAFTIYPIDVPGMQATAGTDVSQRSPSGFGGGGSDRENNVHASLNFLARETGGEALINARSRRALEDAAEDTRSYYWLGFTVRRQANGRRYDIEVDVLKPGLRARTRQGFTDLSQEAEIQMAAEGLLLFGNPPDSLPLELRFGEPKRARRGIVRIPLEVGFTLDEIQFIPLAGRQEAEVQVAITVMDQHGNRSETPVQKVRILGREVPEPGQLFRWQTQLEMRKRKHRVIVIVYDPISGNTLSSSAEISP